MTTNTLKPLSGHAGQTVAKHASSVASDHAHNGQEATENDLQLCAYRKWESAGKPEGDGVQFWLEAEQELKKHK